MPDETRSLKRKTALLESILEDQHHCVSSLQTIESAAFSVEGMQDYIRDAIAHFKKGGYRHVPDSSFFVLRGKRIA